MMENCWWEVQNMNLHQCPFGVSSSQLLTRAPQNIVQCCQLCLWSKWSRAHTDRAQIICCRNQGSRRRRCTEARTCYQVSLKLNPMQDGEQNCKHSGQTCKLTHRELDEIFAAHVLRETPGRCCRDWCRCSFFLLSSGSVQRSLHEPEE